MANATEMVEGDVGAYETKRYDIDADYSFTIPFEVRAGSVQIRGLKESADETPAAGTFAVKVTPATADAAGSTVVTLAADDVTPGDQVRATYFRRVVNAKRVVIKTQTPTARGLAEIEYPVYSAGTDCTESAIKGILRLRIWRCRVTALPGFDTQYKTAATNSVTFSAMDAKRADGQVYELIWEEYDADGNAIAKSEGTVDWNV